MNQIDIDIAGGVIAGRQDDGSSVQEKFNRGTLESGLKGDLQRLAEKPLTLKAKDFERIGTDLGQLLFPGGIGDMIAIGMATGGVRLRIGVDEPALAAVPWEMAMFRGVLFSTTNNALVARRPPGIVFETRPPVEAQNALIVLPDAPDLAGENEAGAVRAALENAGVSCVILSGKVTAQMIGDSFERRPVHVFHYIGHGVGDGVLLYDEAGQNHVVVGAQLRALLSLHNSLRLVVLNGCWTGAVTGIESGSLTGTATSIVATGVPAAVAMQYQIQDPAAVLFAKTFYKELLSSQCSGDVCMAVQAARNACYVWAPGDRSWCAPVVYIRSLDGKIFQTKPAGPTELEEDGVYSHESTDSLVSSVGALKRQADILRARIQGAEIASALGGPGSAQAITEAELARRSYDGVMEELEERTQTLRMRLILLRSELSDAVAKGNALSEQRRTVLADRGYVPFSLDRELTCIRTTIARMQRQITEGEGIVAYRG